jgi:hypothetical protein
MESCTKLPLRLSKHATNQSSLSKAHFQHYTGVNTSRENLKSIFTDFCHHVIAIRYAQPIWYRIYYKLNIKATTNSIQDMQCTSKVNAAEFDFV